MTDAYLDDDGGSVIIAVEAPGPDGSQALWVRVGRVYDGDGAIRDEPGIWIEYQQRYMKSPLDGPVLLTPEVWDQLVDAVEERLKHRRRPWWRRLQKTKTVPLPV